MVQEHGAERILLGRPPYGHRGIERVQVRNERRKMNDHEIDAEGLVEMGFFKNFVHDGTLTGIID